MKKFFLKHKNIIMALVSVMLMLSFSMMGSKPRTSDDNRTTPAGYVNGRLVTVEQVNGARAELQMLDKLGFFGAGSRSWVESMWLQQGGDENQVGLFWYLLCQDAARYQVIPYSVDRALQEAVSLGNAETDITNTINTNRAQGWTMPLFAQAVSHLAEVSRYLNSLEDFPRPISALELTADRYLRKLVMQYVPVDGVQGWQNVGVDAVQDKVAAQFEAYKNIVATPVLGPTDPPVLLAVDIDATGKKFALLGYPGSLQEPQRVYEGEKIAWDGSTIRWIWFPRTAYMDDKDTVRYTFNTGIALGGGGRSVYTFIAPGQDIHGNAPPGLPPEVNGHHFPFGYQFPDRVKVEYLKFSWKALRGRLEVTEADVEAALATFKANKFKFRKNPDLEEASAVSVAAPGASQPATRPHRTDEQILGDWDNPDVKMPYINEQLNLRTTRLLVSLVSAARTKAGAPWNTPTAPDRSAWVNYTGLAQTVGRDPNLNATRGAALQRWMHGASVGPYRPEVATTGTAFLGGRELLALPGIGQAVFAKNTGQPNEGTIFDFATLATHIQQLTPPDRSTPLGQLGLTQGQECPELTDGEGNMYLFRVTDFEKSRPAASLDEVRDQVVTDCRKLARYGQVVKDLQASLAAGKKLEDIAQPYGAPVRHPMEFIRDVAQAPVDVAQIRDMVTTAFNLPDPKEANKPSTAVLQNEQTLSVYPLQVTQITPANGRDFFGGLGDLMRQPEAGQAQFVRDYLDLEAVARRIKFTLPKDGTWPRRAPATTPAK